MKKFILLGVLCALALLPTDQASAHELVVDTARDKGAVLHIDPLDDPIAGKKSTIFLAIRNLPDAATAKGVLLVHNQRGTTQLAVARFHGSMAYADYTFPDQGNYTLTFVIKTAGHTYTFREDEHVARGVELAGNTNTARQYKWANYLFAISIALIVSVCVVAWWRRKFIARASTY